MTEKMSDIVWIADLNLRTNYISPSIKNVLGFSQEERLRQKLDEQLTPHSLSFVLEALSRELALEEQGNADPNRTLKMELEYYHKDGSTRWMELVISGIRNDQGVLTKISWCIQRHHRPQAGGGSTAEERRAIYRSMIRELTGL
ncbi:MAG: PAS domain-containing protein [Desulfomicrobium escambiense]|nr:PAS domain-containing protein [Desulfomicrobium escambiense]